MCSVLENEPVEGKKSEKRRSKNQVKVKGVGKGECMKCAEKSVVLVRNGDPLCKPCFLEYIVHKFRATIGKARVIYQGEKVLLACSGGSSSSAMLDLVVRGLSKEAVKKLRFHPGVVFIDEGELFGRSDGEREVIWESVKNSAEHAGFPCHRVKLEEMLLGTGYTREISDDISEKRSTLAELFNGVGTLTAKEDLFQHFHHWILLKVANEHGYDRVMVGDCSTNLSVKILSDIAQGRGSQLSYNIGFKDTRSDIYLLRPMREFTKKEIEFYNCFNEVSSFSTPSFSTKALPHASINRLTQQFIFGLQATFPSTVSTVLRTGDKLTSSYNNIAVGECCSICFAPLESTGSLVGVNTGLSGGKGSQADSNHSLVCGTSDLLASNNGSVISSSCGLAAGGHLVAGSSGCQTGDNIAGGNGANQSGNSGHPGSNGSSGDGGCCNGSAGTTDSTNVCCSTNSTAACDLQGDREPCCSRGSKANVEGKDLYEHLVSHLPTTLCYGCNLTYKELNGSKKLLPKFVIDNASKTFRRTAMKDEIKEFLIDD